MSIIHLTGGRVVTGLIFLAASLFKVSSFLSFRIYLHKTIQSVISVNIPYDSIRIWALSILIITLELVLGTLLIFNLKKLTTIISGLLVITAFIITNVFSYISTSDSTCACFGDAVKLPAIEMLIIDFLMLLMLLVNLSKYSSPEFERSNEIQEY